MWLNRLFNNKNVKGLTKFEYFEKFQLIELFGLFHQAEKLMKLYKNSDPEFKQFKDDFIEEIYEIEHDNVADFTRVWNWFKPDHEWNKVTQNEGKALGNQIFKIVDYWKRNQDFLSGTKLTLNEENGVVLNEEENGNFGKIRWDTNKENDIEDWCGQFGSFLDAGGKILNQDFEFKYINDDGTLKNDCG
ncbi:hypothetical protein [Elizabethkingia meningoseptica]|uniref:hypothetical protein n=1 Tax=Elizabethkingia meningoseptica TaxID=238 RepID=UPI002011FEBB|nr:hypothetical protein [Elizabethkingia meningoseptica]MCL1674005.1 hypothetical protein [Elizabethkingia meningoseptica]MCL1685354.1 hypothetical protein [Elizabethkingia meningoseptica]